MPVERFYINEPLEKNRTIFLKKEEFHHLSHVIRLKSGEQVEIINGNGVLAQGEIASIERSQAAITISSIREEAPTTSEIILAQALPRQPRLEYILEKSVEIGVTKLWLFPGMLSEKKEFSPSQIERIHHIIISAAKQCGRLYLPTVILSPPLLSWQSNSLPKSSFFGDTRLNKTPFLEILLAQKEKSILIAIGPEKGFHEKETTWMEENLGMRGVHLHPNILRTDTAAIYSLSLASAFLL